MAEIVMRKGARRKKRLHYLLLLNWKRYAMSAETLDI